MNSIGPMNFFLTTDTTDTTIWKPGYKDHVTIPRRFELLSCSLNTLLQGIATYSVLQKENRQAKKVHSFLTLRFSLP